MLIIFRGNGLSCYVWCTFLYPPSLLFIIVCFIAGIEAKVILILLLLFFYLFIKFFGRIIVPLILMEKINSNPQLLRDPLVLFSYISQAKGWTLREEYLRGHALSLQSKKSFPTRTIVLNIDGASKGNHGLATTGGVLYFDDGTFIKRFAHYHGENNSNSFAEVMAMLYGTLITIDMRFSSFMIESDSLTVVSMVQGSSTVPWEIG